MEVMREAASYRGAGDPRRGRVGRGLVPSPSRTGVRGPSPAVVTIRGRGERLPRPGEGSGVQRCLARGRVLREGGGGHGRSCDRGGRDASPEAVISCFPGGGHRPVGVRFVVGPRPYLLSFRGKHVFVRTWTRTCVPMPWASAFVRRTLRSRCLRSCCSARSRPRSTSRTLAHACRQALAAAR